MHNVDPGSLFRKFAQGKASLRKRCRRCPWKDTCYGGCSRTRYFRRNKFSDLDYFCPAYTMFYEHSSAKFKELAEKMRQGG